MLDSEKSNDTGKLILRLTLSVLIIFHGAHKIIHPQSMTGISSMLTNAGLPTFITYGVYLGEIIAPLAIILGFYTRISAAIIFINMLFVIGLAHMSQIFSVGNYGGYALELQFFYLLTSLTVFFTGSGNYAYKPD